MAVSITLYEIYLELFIYLLYAFIPLDATKQWAFKMDRTRIWENGSVRLKFLLPEAL